MPQTFWTQLADAPLEQLAEDPQAATAALEILARGSESADIRAILPESLGTIARATGCPGGALAATLEGEWTVIAQSGRIGTLPVALLGEVLDREAAAAVDGWVAAPLERGGPGDEVLLLNLDQPGDAEAVLARASRIAPVLGRALATVRERRRLERRTEQLSAVLEISNRWDRATEMEPLLADIAAAATRLLKADRASIFLWDRSRKTLVGRPALGVEGGELRIPDDKGVVGQVVQTGESRRIDEDRNQEAIDRQVDKKLGYETRTILCVPLRGANGEVLGAFEMINKLDGNFNRDDELLLADLAQHAAISLENTHEREQLIQTNRQMTEQAAQDVQLIGHSPAIEALRSTVQRVADTELAVLVLGENGTGKEVVSRMIHYLSQRRDRPFIAVNCAALTETLLESELFGHEKGAFTDAHESRPGKFELASGGTLFLDEIGDLSLGGQAKLLRVIEQKVVVRVGGSVPIHTDARVIAATNQNLAEMVRQKKFREDLYFRLNVVTLDLPPLRERPDDVMLLAEHFLVDFCRRARRKVPKFTAAARKRLVEHPWPGNVRELRNLMERLAYLLPGDKDKIDADDLAFILTPGGEAPSAVSLGLPLTEATSQFQSDYINKAIERARGNMSDAAKRLGLHRSNLYRKMKQLGMDLPS